MSKRGKRYQKAAELLDPQAFYSLDDALLKVKAGASAKFDETVDVAINLGVNAKQSDQSVRGATVLPCGTGKTVKVAVFAEGADAEAAQAAGADIVGLDDLAETIQGGEIKFDICIATPATMRVVGKLGQVLGPRGLMPNPKVGTVSADVGQAVKNAKGGQVNFRVDKKGNIHAGIGKASFDAQKLAENLEAFVAAINKQKPASAKGRYIQNAALSLTMSPSIKLDTLELMDIK